MATSTELNESIKQFKADFIGILKLYLFDEAHMKGILMDTIDLDPSDNPQVVQEMKKVIETLEMGMHMLADTTEKIKERVKKLDNDISEKSKGVESDYKPLVTSPLDDHVSSFIAINKNDNEDQSCPAEFDGSNPRQPSGREKRDSKIDSGITLSNGSVPSASITSDINIQEGYEDEPNDLNRPPSSAGTVEESLEDNTRTTDGARTSVAFAQSLGTETQTFLERQGKTTNEYRLQKGHAGHRRSPNDTKEVTGLSDD